MGLIKETFEEKEHKYIKKVKDKLGLTWREFILRAAEVLEKEK